RRAQRAVLARSPLFLPSGRAISEGVPAEVLLAVRPARSRWRVAWDWFWFLTWTLALPWAVVMTSWTDARSGADTWLRPWAFFACLAVLLSSGHQFQVGALSFSPHDVLFHPSKAGVLLARLVHAWWRFVLIGAAWALACFLHVAQASGTPAIAIATCCAVAFLAPLAWNVGTLLRRIVASDASSSLASLVVLAFLAWGVAKSLFWSGGTADPHWSVMLVIGVATVLLAGLVVSWWRTPRAELRALWPDVVRLPRLFVLFVLIAPASWLSEHLALLAAVAMAWLVVFSALGLRHLLAVVNGAEAETRGGAIERATAHGVPQENAPPRRAAPLLHRGRSPSRATWRLHWFRHGITRRDLRRPKALLPFLVMHGGGTAFAAVLVWLEQVAVLWIVLVVFGVSRLTGPVSRERLYHLGIDLRDQARQQVITVLWLALPTLLAGAVVATSFGWTAQRVLVFAGIAAAYALRVGWRGLMTRPESASARACFLLFLALGLAAYFLPDLPPLWWPLVGTFAALGLVGLVRRIVLWREPELLADLVAERERESRPAA
ncbi:MAG TPA: hypothetical protein VFT55_13055, partial [Planctomycetota bacterium]|nr:hypothetical protein [Planctomycetota bacterium]